MPGYSSFSLSTSFLTGATFGLYSNNQPLPLLFWINPNQKFIGLLFSLEPFFVLVVRLAIVGKSFLSISVVELALCSLFKHELLLTEKISSVDAFFLFL